MFLDILCSNPRSKYVADDEAKATVAEKLERHSIKYGEFVSQRRASLAATDRLYHELLVYEWRISALDARLCALDAEFGDAALADDDCQLGLAEWEQMTLEQSESEGMRRRRVLDQSLAAIDELRSEAMRGLEERSTHYAISAPASGNRQGVAKRFVAGDAERLRALERLRAHVDNTFAEISAEARELSSVAPGVSGVQRLRTSMERRREFWSGQLEETFEMWYASTFAMHGNADSLVQEWRYIISHLMDAMQVGQFMVQKKVFDARLVAAVVAFVARSMDAELVNCLGLSGLGEGCEGSLVGRSRGLIYTEDVEIFAEGRRLGAILEAINFLQEASALGAVGTALLRLYACGAAASSSSVVPADSGKTTCRECANGKPGVLLPSVGGGCCTNGADSSSGSNGGAYCVDGASNGNGSVAANGWRIYGDDATAGGESHANGAEADAAAQRGVNTKCIMELPTPLASVAVAMARMQAMPLSPRSPPCEGHRGLFDDSPLDDSKASSSVDQGAAGVNGLTASSSAIAASKQIQLQLLSWFTECLVQALQEAEEAGDGSEARALLALCDRLGDVAFAEAIKSAARARIAAPSAQAADGLRRNGSLKLLGECLNNQTRYSSTHLARQQVRLSRQTS
eukprot:TRINITY_DN24805_c0_g2_i1.p1 TRINITY_DN24805_c0_g2~~TRINITY_DN24805_c0_g2_i1.p1  ORF type:complete len:631 (-),score=146.74 TRINITY_DN24805_c0_g2_i1:31-1923(-)